MHEPRQGKAVLLLMASFAIWGAAFIQLYATQAVGCALGWNGIDVAGPLTLQRALLVASFLGWIAAHLALYLKMRRARAPGFLFRTATDLALAAFGSALFTFSGVLWLSPCL